MTERAPTIYNEPCNCPVGRCAASLERDWLCINRRSGDVKTDRCETCQSITWHQDGQCVRCAGGAGERADAAKEE